MAVNTFNQNHSRYVVVGPAMLQGPGPGMMPTITEGAMCLVAEGDMCVQVEKRQLQLLDRSVEVEIRGLNGDSVQRQEFDYSSDSCPDDDVETSADTRFLRGLGRPVSCEVESCQDPPSEEQSDSDHMLHHKTHSTVRWK